MASSTPQWTSELTDNFVQGEDQLGLEGTAQGYQQHLIPGIITVTDRARYYSYYAWVLYRFIRLPGSSRLLQDFKGSFFHNHELALVLSAYSHHAGKEIINGLVGGGVNNFKVRSWWEKDDPISLAIKYFENPLGGFGQYYQTAMQVMGIIAESEHPKWVYRLTNRGEELAKAYEASISQSAYFQHLSAKGQIEEISHKVAEEYGQTGCLCPEALTQGQDLELLRDTFFRFDKLDHDHPHVRRRLALGVMLDMIERANGSFKADMIRTALYLGEFAPNTPYLPSPAIRDWARRWRLVQIRQLYTFGLQCLWGAFLLRLGEERSLSFEEWLEWAKIHLPNHVFSQSANDYLDDRCAQVGLSGHWSEVHAKFDQACNLSTGFDEYSIYLQAYRQRTDPAVLLRCGLEILTQLFIRFYEWHDQQAPVWNELSRNQRLPMADYFSQLQAFLTDPSWRVGDWLSWLYREFILGQHEFIALEKLRFQGYDTFKFYFQDGRFKWPFQAVDSYREPIRLAANRLFNALTMLSDLGLVVYGEEGNLELSPTGRDYWQRILEAI